MKEGHPPPRFAPPSPSPSFSFSFSGYALSLLSPSYFYRFFLPSHLSSLLSFAHSFFFLIFFYATRLPPHFSLLLSSPHRLCFLLIFLFILISHHHPSHTSPRLSSSPCSYCLTLSGITSLEGKKLLISNFVTNQIPRLNNFPTKKFWATPTSTPGREIRLCSPGSQPITIQGARAGQWAAANHLALWHLWEYMTVLLCRKTPARFSCFVRFLCVSVCLHFLRALFYALLLSIDDYVLLVSWFACDWLVEGLLMLWFRYLKGRCG